MLFADTPNSKLNICKNTVLYICIIINSKCLEFKTVCTELPCYAEPS